MDINRLANVIFERGEKITESTYATICSHIENDMFTLNEHVGDYKSRDSVMSKNIYVLEDGSKILISKELIEHINTLDIDGQKLEKYMIQSHENFRSVIKALITD